MKTLWTLIVMFVAGLTLAATAFPASASARGINDNANFFSPAAKQQAGAIIDDIFRKHRGKEVLVETYNEIPAGATYEQFVQERADKAKLNGVYILIVRTGAHVSVRPDRETAHLFTEGISTGLARRILQDMRSDPPHDKALINAVQFISDEFARNESARAASNTNNAPVVVNRGPTSPRGGFFSSIWSWACLAIGVWIIFSLVRSIFSRRGGSAGGYGGGPGYGGQGYGGSGFGGGFGGYGGGGGWGSSILGGLFGAAAGSWMYDRFFRGDSSSYGGQSGNLGGYEGGGAAAPPDWAAPGDTSQGMGTGGDATFGDGSDFGGGGDASGGGDFDGGGAGDFGGGGGDFGGGGDAGGGDFGGGGDAGGGGNFA